MSNFIFLGHLEKKKTITHKTNYDEHSRVNGKCRRKQFELLIRRQTKKPSYRQRTEATSAKRHKSWYCRK